MRKLNRVGEKYTTNEGYTVEIIEYNSKRDFTILFECGYKVSMNSFNTLLKGKVKNPYHKSVLNIGFLGVGIYKSYFKNKQTNVYKTWLNMFQRAYNPKYHEKYPTYKDVSVCDEWHNFQNFAKWFEENYNLNYMNGWHLDKDIICPNCKIYSPENCCFVPQEINNYFTKKPSKLKEGVRFNGYSFISKIKISNKTVHLGSYPTEEEAFLRYQKERKILLINLANKYKDKLSIIVYNKLIL